MAFFVGTEQPQAMLYIVEIHREPGQLADVMSDVREWLDAHRFEPDAFRYWTADGGVTFRVEFKHESEAMACADAFGGQIRR